MALLTAVAGALTLFAAGCGDEGASEPIESLPPILTTTTTLVPTSTLNPYILLYEIEPGDTLGKVADAFDVPLQTLINFNDEKFSDPNNVPVGVVLEIPPVRLIEELPSPSTSEAP